MARPVHRAVADNARPRLIDQADHEADALVHVVDAVLEDPRDLVVGDREPCRI
jgi:hypothetical protein